MKVFNQESDFGCGAAVIRCLLSRYGFADISEDAISSDMGSNDDIGTTPERMVAWLRGHGFEVEEGTGGTLDLLGQRVRTTPPGQSFGNTPVVVLTTAWGGHYLLALDVNTEVWTEDGGMWTVADPAAHFDRRMNTYQMCGAHILDEWTRLEVLGRKGYYIVAAPARDNQEA